MRGRVHLVACVAVVGLIAACGGWSGKTDGTSSPVSVAPNADGDALAEMLGVSVDGQWRSTGDDRVEVWVCHVPLDEENDLYNDQPLRLGITPAGLVDVLTNRVTPYFEELSHGRYRPIFVVGGESTLTSEADPQRCVEDAVAAASAETNVVLVVADAEHGADQVGGFGQPGQPCSDRPCGVAQSQRYAYVGASDFHPDWGDAPPMDLVEHEIGHTLGWDHSAVDDEGRYLSALDVMSNSAAPRELQVERRDGAGTLAINLFAAGWLPTAGVWMAPHDGGDVVLSPSSGDSGVRLVVLPVAAGTVLTVEYLTPEGLNDHLPAPGVAIHRVQVGDNEPRSAAPVFDEPPYTDLLQPGDELVVDGWTITVGENGRVTVTPTEDGV